MNNTITEEAIKLFLKTIHRKSCDKVAFYDKLFKFLDENNYKVEDETTTERLAYNIAAKEGYMGYEVLSVIEDIQLFAKKMDEYVDKVNYFYFHFNIENEDEKDLCLSEIWQKWDSKPAGGWLAGWCSCGSFYPYTSDLSAKITEDNIDVNFAFKPRIFSMAEIKKIELCSDSNVRFHLTDGTVIAGRPFKLDAGFNFNFAIDPLGLL